MTPDIAYRSSQYNEISNMSKKHEAISDKQNCGYEQPEEKYSSSAPGELTEKRRSDGIGDFVADYGEGNLRACLNESGVVIGYTNMKQSSLHSYDRDDIDYTADYSDIIFERIHRAALSSMMTTAESLRSQQGKLLLLYFSLFQSTDHFDCILQLWKECFESYQVLHRDMKTKLSNAASLESRLTKGKLLRSTFEKARLAKKAVHKSDFITNTSACAVIPSKRHRRLIFEFFEGFLYVEFWKYVRCRNKTHMSCHIVEPKEGIVYSYAALCKTYDLAGYLAGYRIYTMYSNLRLKVKEPLLSAMKAFRYFNFYSVSAHAIRDDLPAQHVLFRQNKGGLMFAKRGIYEVIKYINTVAVSILSTNFMILFSNAHVDLHKQISDLLMNSKRLRKLFSSCFDFAHEEDVERYHSDTSWPKGSVHASILEFIIQGYLRVQLKDRYHSRLQSSLGCKSGSSILTTLQVQSSRNVTQSSSAPSQSSSAPTAPSQSYSAPSVLRCPVCNKIYKMNKPYIKHVESKNCVSQGPQREYSALGGDSTEIEGGAMEVDDTDGGKNIGSNIEEVDRDDNEVDRDDDDDDDAAAMTVCYDDLDISSIPQEHLNILSEHESLDITHDIDTFDAVQVEHAAELDQQAFDIEFMELNM
jgi:hypothetical protein